MRMQTMALVLAVCAAPAPVAAQTRVTSPDNRNVVQVGIHEGALYYIVNRDGKSLITPSRLGFVFRGQPPLHRSTRPPKKFWHNGCAGWREFTGGRRADRRTDWA